MEMEMDLGESETGFDELEVAVRTVQMACFLCQTVQKKLVVKEESLATVADWGVRAVMIWILSECYGSENVSIVGQRESRNLLEAEMEVLLGSVIETVNECLGEASRFGFEVPKVALGRKELLEVISRCKCNLGERGKGRFWVLNSVDGSSGFVCGDQYAIALALIEDGELEVGALGCPNYPMSKEWLNFHHRYYRLVCKLTPVMAESWDRGCVFYARRGSNEAWMQPLVYKDEIYSWPYSASRVRASSIFDPNMATFCKTVEKATTSHSFTADLAQSTSTRKQPLCIAGMVKYAAIARGDANVFMKFVRAGYKEKIWEHAAGVVIIQEAGGVVTDAGGNPLNSLRGMYLEGIDRGIIACANAEMHQQIIQAIDGSYDSSSL